MPFGDHVVTQRQTRSRAFAGGLGGEKGLENFSLYWLRHARTVVLHSDLNGVSQPLGVHPDAGLVVWLCQPPPLLHRVKGIVVENNDRAGKQALEEFEKEELTVRDFSQYYPNSKDFNEYLMGH